MVAKCLTKYNGVYYKVGMEIPTDTPVVKEEKTVEETVKVVEDNTEETQPKKKGGRPRKNKE